MDPSRRIVKVRVPVRVVVGAVLIALTVGGFLIFAVWESGRGIATARMAGVIESKEFRPFDQVERRITLNRTGTVSNAPADGEYIIRVGVPQPDGTTKPFDVWLNDKKRYDAVKVGDPFDVGPYLVPSK